MKEQTSVHVSADATLVNDNCPRPRGPNMFLQTQTSLSPHQGALVRSFEKILHNVQIQTWNTLYFWANIANCLSRISRLTILPGRSTRAKMPMTHFDESITTPVQSTSTADEQHQTVTTVPGVNKPPAGAGNFLACGRIQTRKTSAAKCF